jgi:DNA polymerase-1
LPLINCDVKSLEVVTAAELADDKVLKQEIIDRLDLHALNQARFKLPDRVTAKRFIFKLLYGATAYGYSVDADFIDVRYSQKQWQDVIDEFYAKYLGIKAWHIALQRTVRENDGVIEIPSGRYYKFTPNFQKREPWPLTKIKNYPVQGFGADLVKLARIEFFNRFIQSGLEGYFVQTIHDSLVADVPSKNVAMVAQMLSDSVAKVPDLCYTNWGYKFSLPLTSEILVGPNKKDLVEYVN